MGRKIEFINPFGTEVYDKLIEETLLPCASADTQMSIRHLRNAPPDIDYYYNKHLMETVVFERVMQAEEENYDAVIVGCCYDPGVRVARELVDIPVIGPLEASMQMASYFGHSYTVVTDHHKAVPYLEDLVHQSGLAGSCRGVRCIDWWVKDMVLDPDAVARDTIEKARRIMTETRAEAIVMGCTIIAGCYQRYIMRTNAAPEVVILNPNLMALKMAESLADLKRQGLYTLARSGYYEKPKGHYREQFLQQRRQVAQALGLAASPSRA